MQTKQMSFKEMINHLGIEKAILTCGVPWYITEVGGTERCKKRGIFIGTDLQLVEGSARDFLRHHIRPLSMAAISMLSSL